MQLAESNTIENHNADKTHYVITDSNIVLYTFGTSIQQTNLTCCSCCTSCTSDPRFNITLQNQRYMDKIDLDKVTYDPIYQMELRKTHITNSLTNMSVSENQSCAKCCQNAAICLICPICFCCLNQIPSIDPETRITELLVHNRNSPLGYVKKNNYQQCNCCACLCCCCLNQNTIAWDIFNERGRETMRIVQVEQKKCCDCCDCCDCCNCCCKCKCCEDNPSYKYYNFIIENPKDPDGQNGYGSIAMQVTKFDKNCCCGICCNCGTFYSVSFDIIFPKLATVDEKFMIISTVIRFAKGFNCVDTDVDTNYPLGKKDGWVMTD